MDKSGEMIVGACGIDHDEVVVLLDSRERIDEAAKLDGLVLVRVLRRSARHAEMRRKGEITAGTLGPSFPVLGVMRQGLLPQIEIDGGNALAEIHQRNCDMHGNRGLSRAPLLVSQHHDVRRRRLPACLHQH
jgi:hypothetical protein